MTPTYTGTYINYWPRYSVQTELLPMLKPCPFCGGNVELRDKIDGGAETTFIHCTDCHMWFEKFNWRGVGQKTIIQEWNRRMEE